MLGPILYLYVGVDLIFICRCVDGFSIWLFRKFYVFF